jgi:hypothetical protein
MLRACFQSECSSHRFYAVGGFYTSSITAADFCVNELLSYTSFYRDKSNAASLRQTVLSFYALNDISQAKQLLIQKYLLQLESCPLLAERRNSSTRSVHEAELDDIIGMFDFLDSTNTLNIVTFVSVNLDNLPKFGPEEFNLAAVVEKQVRAEAAIKVMAVAIEQLQTRLILVIPSTRSAFYPLHHVMRLQINGC